MLTFHPPSLKPATIRPCRRSRFTMPSTKDMYGTMEQWVSHRNDPHDGIFCFSDGQLEAARQRQDHWIGRVVGVDCYLVEHPPVVAN
jgi:hypothetical protein